MYLVCIVYTVYCTLYGVNCTLYSLHQLFCTGAVRQFVEKFERVRGDRGQLEDALTSFGGQVSTGDILDTSYYLLYLLPTTN